jgi:formylglycine-generating enzyme required for sulfatase activity
MAAWTVLEHEAMHQETLAYMWHQLPYTMKKTVAPIGAAGPHPHGSVGAGTGVRPYTDRDRISIPAGVATLGTYLDEAPFAWDNELPAHRVRVDAFTVDAHDVTNARFLEFVEAGGYRDPRWWRPEDWAWVEAEKIWHPPFWEQAEGADLKVGPWFYRAMLERIPLPALWPVYVTWAEAQAFARWDGGRLLTEPEFHRAAFGTPGGDERRYPWGDAEPAARHGNFDFERWDPVPAGSRPDGASAFGVHDMMGNGWEWTATVFAGFSGFTPLPTYPEYSADFFDGQHFVMKGGSPVTARLLLRRGFRNWFRPQYPYVYATFRCAR